MSIRIVLPEGKGPRLSRGTKIYTETGEEIKGVTRISLDLDRDRVMTATITVIADDIENFDVEGVVVVRPENFTSDGIDPISKTATWALDKGEPVTTAGAPKNPDFKDD